MIWGEDNLIKWKLGDGRTLGTQRKYQNETHLIYKFQKQVDSRSLHHWVCQTIRLCMLSHQPYGSALQDPFPYLWKQFLKMLFDFSFWANLCMTPSYIDIVSDKQNCKYWQLQTKSFLDLGRECFLSFCPRHTWRIQFLTNKRVLTNSDDNSTDSHHSQLFRYLSRILSIFVSSLCSISQQD